MFYISTVPGLGLGLIHFGVGLGLTLSGLGLGLVPSWPR